MATVEDAPDDQSAPGPRRSTWAPPPGGFDESALRAGDPARAAVPSEQPVDSEPEPALPAPPPRRSLDDDEIVRALEAAQGPTTETIDLIAQIEQQMSLREREVAEYREWEAEMVALGTPDAFAALENSRGSFTGVIPVITAESAYAVTVPVPGAIDEADVAERTDAADRAVAHARPGEDETASVADPDAKDTPASQSNTAAAPARVHSFEALLAGAVDLPHRAEPLELAEDHLAPSLDQLSRGWRNDELSGVSGPDSAIDVAEPDADAAETDADVSEPDIDPAETDAAEPDVDAGDAVEPDATASVSDVEVAQPHADSAALADSAELAGADEQAGTAELAATAAPAQTADPVDVTPPLEPAPPAEPAITALPARPRERTRASVWQVEAAGLEPTPREARTGRASRMLWLWFALSSSAVSMGVGAVVFSLGLSLRQAIVAVLVGVGLSFLPLGLGTLAGKWSGQPTMVVSRASFGLRGNIVPALLAVITRVFWASVLLWLLATSMSSALAHGQLLGALSEGQASAIALAVAFVIAAAIAFFGFRLLAIVQLVLGIASAVLVIGLIVLTAGRINLDNALLVPDGDWFVALGGAVVVFSVVGLAWATSASDLARYQQPGAPGGRSMVWATVGATVPPFVLISWGALLSASDSALAPALATDPIAALAAVVPSWFLIPLMASAALSLLAAVSVALYSSGFAIQATGLRVPRQFAVVMGGILLLIGAAVLSAAALPFDLVLRDVATTLAVPVAAWVGIFAAELMIRNRRFSSRSLLASGGAYADVRWLNLGALVVITVIGYGFTAATLDGYGWQGYLLDALNVARDSPLALTDFGVLVALGLGLITPIAFGVAAIRDQESAGA
ncbi:cytosine permease [Salinibacterium sp. ZJ454]|uniref:purine-cytosine permease family protein n=1 Tax=Salinibacterium sp. ZJ454 TaxID=2708339 RepID=UPI001421A529|nr:cytosine permease [Salinibacterium sp. ZJ454]